MPINIPDDLPAGEALEAENIFVMREERATSQDIRPMKILIVNLMPRKVETEIQILRLLSNSPLQLDIFFLQMATHESKNISQEYLDKFYCTFDDIKDRKFDGMIITGAPLENIDYEEVDYWKELCEIMDWSHRNVFSTMYICWGAYAGLYHHYKIPKHTLPSKISGIFEHITLIKDDPIVIGFDDAFLMPQSRYSEVLIEDIHRIPCLHVIATSKDSGIGVIVSEGSRQVFITGHFEYDKDTLAYEYDRDSKRGMNPKLPENYFPNDDPCHDPIMKWRGHATLLFINWLNYYVYQGTPHDLNEIGKDKKNRE